jgi:hypothetical protein
LKIKENVFEQKLLLFDSIKDFRQNSLINGGFKEIGFQYATLTVSKDVSSHNPFSLEQVKKRLLL